MRTTADGFPGLHRDKVFACGGGVVALSVHPTPCRLDRDGPGKAFDAIIMSRQRLHIFYAGRVQGVGFRFTV